MQAAASRDQNTRRKAKVGQQLACFGLGCDFEIDVGPKRANSAAIFEPAVLRRQSRCHAKIDVLVEMFFYEPIEALQLVSRNKTLNNLLVARDRSQVDKTVTGLE